MHFSSSKAINGVDIDIERLINQFQHRAHIYQTIHFTNGFDASDKKDWDFPNLQDPHDHLAHFLLTLHISCEGNSYQELYVKLETRLFELRLNALITERLRDLLDMWLTEMRLSNLEKPLNINILEAVESLRRNFEHVFLYAPHSINCDTVIGTVGADYCQQLIASHQVECINGSAVFYCANWRQMLTVLYAAKLRETINQLSHLIDPEMNQFHSKYAELFETEFAAIIKLFGAISREKLDLPTNLGVTMATLSKFSDNFPLCMKKYYTTLVKDCRLSNNDRFNFTVFLRGIGMSRDDQIEFWRQTYSKPRAAHTSCKHSWNEKKYTYSINHIYGLIGRCEPKPPNTCEKLFQLIPGANSLGGCPYVHQDSAHLSQLLRDCYQMDIEDIGDILSVDKSRPDLACAKHLNWLRQRRDLVAVHDTPIQSPVTFVKVLLDK